MKKKTRQISFLIAMVIVVAIFQMPHNAEARVYNAFKVYLDGNLYQSAKPGDSITIRADMKKNGQYLHDWNVDVEVGPVSKSVLFTNDNESTNGFAIYSFTMPWNDVRLTTVYNSNPWAIKNTETGEVVHYTEVPLMYKPSSSITLPIAMSDQVAGVFVSKSPLSTGIQYQNGDITDNFNIPRTWLCGDMEISVSRGGGEQQTLRVGGATASFKYRPGEYVDLGSVVPYEKFDLNDELEYRLKKIIINEFDQSGGVANTYDVVDFDVFVNSTLENDKAMARTSQTATAKKIRYVFPMFQYGGSFTTLYETVTKVTLAETTPSGNVVDLGSLGYFVSGEKIRFAMKNVEKYSGYAGAQYNYVYQKKTKEIESVVASNSALSQNVPMIGTSSDFNFFEFDMPYTAEDVEVMVTYKESGIEDAETQNKSSKDYLPKFVDSVGMLEIYEHNQTDPIIRIDSADIQKNRDDINELWRGYNALKEANENGKKVAIFKATAETQTEEETQTGKITQEIGNTYMVELDNNFNRLYHTIIILARTQ